MAHVYCPVTIQLARDVDAGLANIRTTSRLDITNPSVTLIQYTALMSRIYSHVANVLYERGPATYTPETQDVDSMVD